MPIGKSFTLIELIIVVAVILILAFFTLPLGFDFLTRHSLRMEAETLKNNLKNAQFLAISAKNNSSWGVKFFPEANPPYYVIFQGDSYANRNPAEDEIFYISKEIILEIVGEYTEVIFEKNTGSAKFQ